MARPLSAALLAACLSATALLAPGAATADVPPSPISPKLIGMSAPSNLWNQRLGEVGSCGVEARRIFASLTSNGRSQSTIISATVAAGQMPILSYKVPSVATLNSGGYDTWLDALHDYLAGLNTQVTVTFNHEPYPELTGAQFLAGSTKFLDHVQDTNIAVGPIMNGFLLDRRVSTFDDYSSPALLARWDYFGVDTYQSGSQQSPGSAMPGRAVPLLANWLDAQGFGDMPIGIGEYNGYSAAAIQSAGETILSTPEVWFGLAFDSDVGAKGYPLTGTRLAAFKNTKADARALHSPAC